MGPRMALNRTALIESARVGADALRANPTRTLLSTTGVVIGVAALVAAFAITDGVEVWSRALIARESSVQDVSVTSITSQTINGRRIGIHGYPVFSAEDGRAAAQEIPNVVNQALTLSGNAGVEFQGRRANALLTASTATLADFAALPIQHGRFYTESEVQHRSPVVVIGAELAQELAGNRDALWMLGRQIVISGRRREIIGIIASRNTSSVPDLVAFAPIRGGTELFEPSVAASPPVLRIKAHSIEAVDSLKVATLNWLAERYGKGVEKLHVSVANQQLENTRQAILLTKLLLGMLVGLILTVGGIGIMNVLLAAVSERTREIGIRKAVGARSRDIQLQFLVESVTVTGTGAALGFVLGVILAFGGTALFRYWLGSGIYPVVRPTTALLAVISSLLVGIGFGTYPARRAARLSPVDAIARE
ncbi:MAG: ABC transporter permease [Gemmatimonadaceae bacterium]|nr:ABC transporter permease [Gemmatimonadaceae bacterium]